MENRNLKILAIDDYEDNLIILSALIEEFFDDVEIFTALDGPRGIDLAIKEDPDVIILDIFMPGMDGFEVCEKLKKVDELKDIPVLFVTALKGDKHVRIRALEAGAEAFLAKPIDESELTAQIRAMKKIRIANLEKRDEHKRLAKLVEAKTHALISANRMTEDLLDELRIENEERIKSEAALLEAQKLAHIGSFEFNVKKKSFICTKVTLEIFGIEPRKFKETLDEIYEFVHPEDLEYVKLCNKRSAYAKDMMEYECRIVMSDGEVKVVHIRFRYVYDTCNTLISYMGTIQDITERKKRETDLRSAREEAEKAKLIQSKFLSNMSHEIRTPLNGIMGMIDLTLMTKLSEEQTENLTVARTSANALLTVINDILDYTKLEANRLTISHNTFNIRELVKNIHKLYVKSAREKSLKFDIEIDGQLPSYLVSDEIRLQQIINNLVGNAIKFTNEGSIKVKLDLLSTTQDRVSIKFSVKDTGIGIPKDKIGQLFKRFSQIDDSRTRNYGGTGLGLAISKNLVFLLNGNLNCNSYVGEGSEFYFILTMPFAVTEQQNEVKELNEVKNIDIPFEETTKVLIVDDDMVNQKLMKALFKKQGLNTDVASNGAEAVEMYKSSRYDIVFMDVSMPVMDGFEAVNLMKSQEMNTNLTPIVAMTAFALKGDREKCIDAGFDDYLSKPIDFKSTLQLIYKYKD